MNNLQLIKKALYYIDEHIYEELTYKRLAEVFGYSAFHFHRIFSSVTELSITEYIRKRRLMQRSVISSRNPIGIAGSIRGY